MNITIKHYTQHTHIAHSFQYTLNMHQSRLYSESLRKFKFEIIEIIFLDHRGIKQAVKNKKQKSLQIFGNFKIYFYLNHDLVKNPTMYYFCSGSQWP